MIEFQYFEDCPNAVVTLENLKRAMNLLKINDIRIINVQDNKEIRNFIFQGSPSILVDGVDIYTLEPPNIESYACRLYNIDGSITGILPYEYIIHKLKRLYNIY